MRSRGRSIRLRISFLVAIPLITMLGLFSYVAYTSVTSWRNLDRAPNLIRATSEPLTAFVTLLQDERRAAVVYLSQPTAATLAAYQSSVAAAGKGEIPLTRALRSPATTGNATPAETEAIDAMVADVGGMTGLRHSVGARRLSPLAAFAAYTRIISDQDAVFQAEAASMTDSVAYSQGLGLISSVNAREDVSEQDALLAGALAAHALGATGRVAFNQAAGRQQEDTQLYRTLLSGPELRVFSKTMDAQAPPRMQASLARIQQGIGAGLSLAALEREGLSAAGWRQLTQTWQRASYNAATDAADAVLAVDQQLASDARQRVWETAALGAAGLILTLLVTILLGRSINRRLSLLRSSALTLAHEQLPAVVARLRRGESVDVTAEAPPLRVGGDEIGEVGQAIDIVRQTAIRSAVEEARVRQGVNDMFRNLARRSQSLLQRQLSMLDEMERQASDPDVLADLFRMDHLTTRMRRHAEGLIILSGAAPGRGWSAPVKLVDVMRGAVAEVEEYARVTVATQSRAALAGSAVTDVIHLLAELIENAATLSPPATQVRVSGETVARGFAIEVEDRGLGLSPRRLAELNDRLANPPEINPANTEQLGLFVVGQLARRHRISVTLRPSPYGGTTAVVLVPAELIVQDTPVAITAGDSGPATLAATPPAGSDWSAARGRPARHDDPGRTRREGNGSPPPAPQPPAPGPDARDAPAGPGSRADGTVSGGAAATGAAAPTIRISGALRHPRATPGAGLPRVPGTPGTGGTPDGGARRGRHGSSDVRVVTGVPVGPPSKPPVSTFDVFTPIRRSVQDGTSVPPPGDLPSEEPLPGYPGQPHGAPGGPPPAAVPGGGPGGDGSGGGGPGGDGHGGGSGGAAAGDGGQADGDGQQLLPRRVRQASLAPQLRTSAGANGQASVPQATAASLAVMRNTLSAMQRGWQQGRSQSQPDTEDGSDGD